MQWTAPELSGSKQWLIISSNSVDWEFRKDLAGQCIYLLLCLHMVRSPAWWGWIVQKGLTCLAPWDPFTWWLPCHMAGLNFFTALWSLRVARLLTWQLTTKREEEESRTASSPKYPAQTTSLLLHPVKVSQNPKSDSWEKGNSLYLLRRETSRP